MAGFFSRLSSSMKQGAFLAGCQNACLKHGSDIGSAELFVQMGKEILLSFYDDGQDAETAVAMASYVIIAERKGMPMNMLGGAHRYAVSFIKQHPGTPMAARLEEVVGSKEK